MDHLRSCYVSFMRLYTDRPDVLTKGRWYWCPEGAADVGFPHLFTSHVWDYERGFDPAVGEVATGPHPWFNGKANPRYKGQHVCGEAVMQTGALFSQKGSPQSDSNGIPRCCNPLPIPRAGDADDGQALQAWGTTFTASGGDGDGGGEYRRGCDADDGSAEQVSDYTQYASIESDADDGIATQTSAYDQVASGGDSDDGASTQTSAYDQVASGGDSDDGSGSQSSAYDQIASGGDSDDGVATQSSTSPDMPIGAIFLWGGTTTPANCVPCDGSSYSTSGTYAALFAAISYNFGGSGANFNVPDFRGRMPCGISGSTPLPVLAMGDTGGEKDHTLTTAEMPAHTHSVPVSSGASNALSLGGTLQVGGNSGSTGGGGAHNNMPPYIGVNWMIQYA